VRLAFLSKALSLKFDTLTRYLTVSITAFGLRKLFSLDFGPCMDIINQAENMVGFTFPTSKDDFEAEGGEVAPTTSSLHDSLGFTRLAIVKKLRGGSYSTKYMELCDHPEKPNDCAYSLATDVATFCAGVRWFDESGLPIQGAGVPLVPPEGMEHFVYSISNGGQWVQEQPEMSLAMVAACFPISAPAHYR